MSTLYVSDLDGTLLNSDSVLSEYTISTLNRLQRERHVLFSIATARTPATVVGLMARVEGDLPYIVMAGAALWDNSNCCYEDVRVIDNSVVFRLLQVFDKYEVHPFVYARSRQSIEVLHEYPLTADERDFILPRLGTPYKYLTLQKKVETGIGQETVLLFSLARYVLLQELRQKIIAEGIPCYAVCYHDLHDGDMGILEIYAENSSKAQAVCRLASRVGADRVVTFGDNMNDIPMLSSPNFGVCVANAIPEAKRIARQVIGTNDEDAVARWIEDDVRQCHG